MSNIMTPKFRVSFPNVFKARLNDQNGQMEFGVMAIFPAGADLTALKKAAQEAIVEKWGSDQKKWPKNLRSPFRKCEEKEYENDAGKMVLPPGMEPGGIYLNLKSRQKPGLVDANVQDIIDEKEFYAGCYARATVYAHAYEVKGNTGVSFWLQNVQKVGEGDPLGSRTKAQDDFAPISGAGTSEGASADSLFN
jgi:hypothetical protein